MIPHNNSARFYDFVFNKRFGAAYQSLKEANPKKITGLFHAILTVQMHNIF